MLGRLLQVYAFLSVIAIFAIKIEAISNSDCTASINDFANTHPLPIQTTFGKPRIVFPTISDKIIVKQNDMIEIFCPGSYILINDTSLKVDLANITCNRGQFIFKLNVVTFPSLSCSKSLKDVARYTGNYCLGSYEEFEIGYEYKNDFLPLIKGCYDRIKQNTLYTISTISKAIGEQNRAFPSSLNWKKGPFYDKILVNDLYKQAKQKIAINSQLEISENSNQYIGVGSYFCRGHLAPKADFIYCGLQNATFYFANAIPQWNLLNNGNWKILEVDLRRLAFARRSDLTIYTGTSEILTLQQNSSKRWVELFLGVQQAKKTIPIPKFIWKVVYDASSGKGVAFVGVNHPHLEDVKAYTICKNICNQLSYIHINMRNYAQRGYVYCCEVGDLIRRVSTIPIRNITKLLT